MQFGNSSLQNPVALFKLGSSLFVSRRTCTHRPVPSRQAWEASVPLPAKTLANHHHVPRQSINAAMLHVSFNRLVGHIDINIHNIYMCVYVSLSIYSVQCGMLLFYYMNLYYMILIYINWYYMNVCNDTCIGWALQNPFPASDRVHLRLSKALWQPLNLLQQSRSRKFSLYIHDTEHFWYVQQIWRWSFATLDTLGKDLLLGP